MKQVILLLMVISLVLLSGCTTEELTGKAVLLDNNTSYHEVALQEEIKILKQQISDLEEEKGALQKKVENMTLSVSKEEVVTEIPSMKSSLPEKDIYRNRETASLFGDKRWGEIQSMALEYMQAGGLTKRPYWYTGKVKDTLYYVNNNSWSVIVESTFKDETAFWYENVTIMIDETSGGLLNILSEEEQGVDFTIKSINTYEEEGKLYVQVIISHPVSYTARSPLNIYAHPNSNLNEPFQFDDVRTVQLSLRKKEEFDLVWIDDITYESDKYKQLKIESLGIDLCDPDLDVCEFVIKEYNGTIDLE